MNSHRWMPAILLLSLAASVPASEIATINQSKVNVRGQPALVGEVITQLNKGDQVNVLEEITLEKPKPGEPAKWAKIKMPPNTPVWVSASLIDPATKTVTARRLNLRAGPGENYSTIGRLQKGDTIKEIRVVEDWMEIEPPEIAFAFVTANAYDRAAAAPVAETKPSVREPAPEPAATAPVVAAPIVAQPLATPPEPPPTTIPAPEVKLELAPAKATEPTNAVIAAPIVEPTPAVSPEPPKAKTEGLPRRIVRREGIVRSTTSPQAPTYTELISPETRRTIDWLHSEKSGIELKPFRGQKVIITGEEGIDPRWPKVPVIEVETIQLAP